LKHLSPVQSGTTTEELMIMTESAAPIRIVDSPGPAHRPFLPGMGKQWLMPLYDPFTRLLGVQRFRAELIRWAGIAPGEKVLDVGCGSGDLLVALARTMPGVELTGLDPDRVALGRAARKAAAAGVGVTLIRGYADDLALEDGSLDHVVSSLAIHHLDVDSRRVFAAEARRVLRPGGKITILDFGGPSGDHAHGPRGHLNALLDTAMRRSPQLQAEWDNPLPELLRSNGFDDAAEVAHRQSGFGSLTIVRATR
jgi:ubiquinone/menaquinone biosynthesis C-methylase UbiE